MRTESNSIFCSEGFTCTNRSGIVIFVGWRQHSWILQNHLNFSWASNSRKDLFVSRIFTDYIKDVNLKTFHHLFSKLTSNPDSVSVIEYCCWNSGPFLAATDHTDELLEAGWKECLWFTVIGLCYVKFFTEVTTEHEKLFQAFFFVVKILPLNELSQNDVLVMPALSGNDGTADLLPSLEFSCNLQKAVFN